MYSCVAIDWTLVDPTLIWNKWLFRCMQCVLSPKCVKYILDHGITLSESITTFFCGRVTCTWKAFALLHVIWSTGDVQRQTNLLPICRITKRFFKKIHKFLNIKVQKKSTLKKEDKKKKHKKRMTFRIIILKRKSELKTIKIKKKQSQTIIYSIYLFKYSKWKQWGQGKTNTETLVVTVSFCVTLCGGKLLDTAGSHKTALTTQTKPINTNLNTTFTKSPGRGRI